ncbi:MAG: hypothetical protein QOC63_2589 [Mycobacterium sp.]|jgi:hypothetical protein|nr:hypothetical protein [Mycobacterium sp.]
MNPLAGQRDARRTLLVGSIPAPDTHEAVKLALTQLGRTLMCIPDGETGPRSQWVASIIAELRNHPAVMLQHDGQWSDYNDRPRYRVRRGAALDPDLLRLGYDTALQQSRPVLDGLVAEYGLEGAIYQVGVASGFDLALLAFGPAGALRYRKAFNKAASREIGSIRAILGDDVVFQIELPAELVAVSRAPGILRPAVARLMAGVSVEPAELASNGTKFGVHLCFGDLNHKALMNVGKDCAPIVQLANAIAARWPRHTSLAYLHIPLAAGDNAPSLAESYYAPLANLSLPTDTRLVAGFVHEALGEDQLREVLRMVESAAGRRVDVAAPCGLGRRDAAMARHLMRASRQLTVATTR